MAKILVIDDEDESLLFVSSVLGKEYEITTANSWLQGSDALIRDAFDLILLDINMPGLSGDKLAEVLRKRLPDKSLNIVLFSGLEEDELAKKARAINARGYIHKPCPRVLFTLRVQRLLQ